MILPGFVLAFVVGAGACSSAEVERPLQTVDQTYRLEWMPGRTIAVRQTESGEPTWDRDPTFVMHNAGERSFLFLLESTEPWLQIVSPVSGMLRPGHSIVVELRLAREHQAPPGDHVGRLQVLNWVTLACEVEVLVSLGVSAAQAAQQGDAGESRPSAPADHRAGLKAFVSSSDGDDAWSGRSAERPKRTIRAGLALLRDGYPDHLHLKRGDVFEEGLGNWTRCGRSATEPMVVASYGDGGARPQLRTGAGSALTVHGRNVRVRDVVFRGLEFIAHTHDGSNGSPKGVSLLEPCERVAFEDCWFANYLVNLVFQGAHRDLVLRRCVVVDAFTVGGGHAQGVYLDGVDGCLIEECLIDHNGWRTDVAGAKPDIYRHNIYVQKNCDRIVLRGNIIARGASHGAQMRSGGVVEDNLFIRNAIGLLVGTSAAAGMPAREGRLAGNIFLDGRDIDGAPRGWAVDLVNLASAELVRNVIAGNDSGSDPLAIRIDSTGPIKPQRVRMAENLIHDWGGGIVATGDHLESLELVANELQEHERDSTLLNIGPATSVVSRDNLFFSAAKPERWFRCPDFMSLSDWLEAVHDAGSRSVRRERPMPTLLARPLHLALPWPAELDRFVDSARVAARVSTDEAPTGTAMCRNLRAAFGIGNR